LLARIEHAELSICLTTPAGEDGIEKSPFPFQNNKLRKWFRGFSGANFGQDFSGANFGQESDETAAAALVEPSQPALRPAYAAPLFFLT
jgi:hypothetical protein